MQAFVQLAGVLVATDTGRVNAALISERKPEPSRGRRPSERTGCGGALRQGFASIAGTLLDLADAVAQNAH